MDLRSEGCSEGDRGFNTQRLGVLSMTEGATGLQEARDQRPEAGRGEGDGASKVGSGGRL